MRLAAVVAVSAVVLATVGAGVSPAAPADVRANRIGILNFEYHPDPKTVAPRVMVSVVNGDGIQNGIPHSLTSDAGLFNTGVFTTGTRSFRAPAAPGRYPYHCQVHGFMHGTLVVSG